MSREPMEISIFTGHAIDSLSNEISNHNGSADSALSLCRELAEQPGATHLLTWDYGSVRPELKLSDDGEASVQMHRYLGQLKPDAASDRRLWSYLSAVDFYDYTRIRWKSSVRTSASRWMFDRVLIRNSNLTRLSRNSIARLWHASNLLVDTEMKFPLTESRKDPYAYAREIFRKQDFHTSLFQRTIVHNDLLIRVILDHLNELDVRNEGEYVQSLALEIYLRMGFQQLQTLTYEELYSLVSSTGRLILQR